MTDPERALQGPSKCVIGDHKCVLLRDQIDQTEAETKRGAQVIGLIEALQNYRDGDVIKMRVLTCYRASRKAPLILLEFCPWCGERITAKREEAPL